MKVAVAFSGGRSSAFMAWHLKHRPKEFEEAHRVRLDDIAFAFANTGREHPDTLRFVREFSEWAGIKVTWLESEPRETGSSTYRIVDPTQAATDDQWRDPKHPFHANIAAYGVPNHIYQSCTRELKTNPMNAFFKDRFGGKGFWTAIGIRSDEPHRFQKASRARKDRLIYPLIKAWPVTSEDVIEFFEGQPFDLRIPSRMGNCITCHKKSHRQLLSNFRDLPGVFDFNDTMEELYSMVDRAPVRERQEPRLFFRGRTSTKALLSAITSSEAPDERGDGCSDSCEAF